MSDERWNGFRLEVAAIEFGVPEPSRSNLVPLGSNIQGVVFEPCGVLYDDSAWRRWLWQLLARMGLASHYTPFFRVWDCEFQEAVWSGQLDLWSALSQFLRSAGMPLRDIDEVIAASRAKFRRFDQDTRPFPDVGLTVRNLHAGGIQIAVIAHARLGPSRIRERLDQIGISKLVNRVISPRMRTVPDDDLTPWQQSSLAGLPGATSEWLYVGRQQTGLDVARRLGLKTVAFNHDADAVADAHIEQFSQLGQLLCRPGSTDFTALSAKAA